MAVASAESFSRAADELHVAQSAVSRQVGLLERELGVKLLHRTTHEVALTDAGRHLLERGESLARDADALWEDMRAFAAGERGRVRVGYSTSIGYETAPRLIGVAREALPDVDVTSVVLPSIELPDAVPCRTAPGSSIEGSTTDVTSTSGSASRAAPISRGAVS